MGEKKINSNTKQCPTFLRVVTVSSPLDNNDNDTVMKIMIFFPQRLHLKFKYQILSITGQMRIHCLHIIVTRRAYGLFFIFFSNPFSLIYRSPHHVQRVFTAEHSGVAFIFLSSFSIRCFSLFKICSCFSCLF